MKGQLCDTIEQGDVGWCVAGRDGDLPGVVDLTGRCGRCRYREICRGGSRLRAFAVHDDPFAPDPQWYLREEEIEPPATSETTATDAD